MRTIIFFVIATALTFFLTGFTNPEVNYTKTVSLQSTVLSSAQVDSLQTVLPVDLTILNQQGPVTGTDIISYLVSVIGGLLTTVLLYFLHKWFPNIFPTAKLKDYKKKNFDEFQRE
jgi:hypothetical protein